MVRLFFSGLVCFCVSACASDGAFHPSPPAGDSPAAEQGADTATDIEEISESDPWYPDGVCQAVLDCSAPISAVDKVHCEMQVQAADGTVFYDGPSVVWYRGRSSLNVEKHQYGVELRDASDQAREVNLLGMGAESDWILNGNYYDRSLMRNKLGYDLFQSFGGPERYAPESACCELTLGGEYLGLYLLVERIKRDEARLDLALDEHGGTFVLKQDTEECFYVNALATGTCWKLVSPNEDDITADQVQGVQQFLAGWEGAVLGADPLDEETGVFSWVDLESAVDIVLLEEFVKNEDFLWTSLHIWKDQGGLLHFSPWDLDMGYGQFRYYDTYGSPETWIKWRPEMVSVMAESPRFRERMRQRWDELRQGELALDSILGRMDALQETMGDAIQRNFERWDITTVNYGDLFYQVESYEEEDAAIRAWVEVRLAWMDANLETY